MEDSYVLQLLKPKFKDFHLCFCGFAECKPLHSYGPAARPNYILHYVMKGKGIYQVGETKYQLKEGQAFLIEPESLTFYQADKKEPWSYLWVGFGGTEAQRFVRDLGLNSRQLTCECEYEKSWKKLYLKCFSIRIQLWKIFTISRENCISFSPCWLAGLKFSNMWMIQRKYTCTGSNCLYKELLFKENHSGRYS